MKQLQFDPTVYESLQKEKDQVGDVIYIEANSGAGSVRVAVTRMPPSLTWKQRSTSSFPREMCTKRKLCNLSDCMTLMQPTHGREGRMC